VQPTAQKRVDGNYGNFCYVESFRRFAALMEDLENKEKILKGAMELFMKYGVRSVSMDDIARHLAMSKKTIYQYFADKEDVISIAAQKHFDKSRLEFDEITEASKNAIDELVKISGCLKKEMGEINPSLLFDLHKYHPKAWNLWLDHKNKYIRESVVRNLRQGIEEGHFRPDINADVIATLRLEQVQIAFDDRIFSHDKFNIVLVQAQIFDHFVYGLVTEKGRKLFEKYKQELRESELVTTPRNI
jgi:TetR/AcrR family transcriptional regulator, cholesterol catabolism regulator